MTEKRMMSWRWCGLVCYGNMALERKRQSLPFHYCIAQLQRLNGCRKFWIEGDGFTEPIQRLFVRQFMWKGFYISILVMNSKIYRP